MFLTRQLRVLGVKGMVQDTMRGGRFPVVPLIVTVIVYCLLSEIIKAAFVTWSVHSSVGAGSPIDRSNQHDRQGMPAEPERKMPGQTDLSRVAVLQRLADGSISFGDLDVETKQLLLSAYHNIRTSEGREEDTVGNRPTYVPHLYQDVNISDRIKAFSTYRIAGEAICTPLVGQANDKNMTALIWVHSASGHFENRKLIRETWKKDVSSTDGSVRVVFALGLTQDDNQTVQSMIEQEAAKHGDMVQMNFVDVYHNVSYKVMGGFAWTRRHCRQAKIFMKVDDDVFIISWNLLAFLENWTKTGVSRTVYALFLGIFHRMAPNRYVGDKWYVSEGEWPGATFGNHSAPGMVYLLSADLLEDYLTVLKKVRWLWLEDVWVTGIMREEIDAMVAVSSSGITLPKQIIETRNLTDYVLRNYYKESVYSYLNRKFKTFAVGELLPDRSTWKNVQRITSNLSRRSRHLIQSVEANSALHNKIMDRLSGMRRSVHQARNGH